LVIIDRKAPLSIVVVEKLRSSTAPMAAWLAIGAIY